jgi:A/G-specific adenine glycosylase
VTAGGPAPLAAWYAAHGRHELPWRATRDRWAVLISEVMLQQTQVGRVAGVWPAFLARFPTPEAMAGVSAGEVIAAWGTLGYPRRARRLWEAAAQIAAGGWPDDLTVLPGIGRYTAEAVDAQVDGRDAPAIETNIRRVVERHAGRVLTPAEAAQASRTTGAPLTGRDRLLALMDVGAVLCRPRLPRCGDCPLAAGCATAGAIAASAAAGPGAGAAGAITPSAAAGAGAGAPEHTVAARPSWTTLGRPPRQAAYEGSFRQRRGRVLAELRRGPRPSADLDAAALAALVADGLATLDGPVARLP